jgi:hypothetical protein
MSNAAAMEGATAEVASRDVAETSAIPVVPGSPGMPSDPTFVLLFFYAYFVLLGFSIV